MRNFIGTVLAAALTALSFSPASAQVPKTAAQCSADYSANKPALQAAKVKKADFITSCRAGNEVIPAAPAAAAPPPAAPAPAKTGIFGLGKAKPAAAPAATAAPTGANQFSTEAQAKGHCPAGLVVWVNTNSGIYHFPGTKNYGTTEAGAYMCETDATAAGDRASKTERHP